jgi:hypothetical protein
MLGHGLSKGLGAQSIEQGVMDIWEGYAQTSNSVSGNLITSDIYLGDSFVA